MKRLAPLYTFYAAGEHMRLICVVCICLYVNESFTFYKIKEHEIDLIIL